MRTAPVLPILALVLVACSEPAPDPACEPEREAFEAEALPRIERYCGQCHGESPRFGAPVSLLDPDALLETRADGTRLVDRIAARIADGSMPPVGMPRMPDADARMLASWASCGEVEVPPGTGLRASRPPLLAPETAPAGLEVIELHADEHPVGPGVRDEYRCFVFDVALDGPRLARRIEMAFDETRVLHHLVLMRDVERRTSPGEFDCYDGSGMPAGSQYLYAWAPGQDALEFPEGGLRIEDGERFVVQIHYNNGAAIPDVADSSGVRLHLGPLGGPEFGMIAIGPTSFSLPARQQTSVSSRCTIAAETTLLAGMPHMHLLGSSFSQRITRAAGGSESLIALEGWSFETQLFYALPVTLHPGDVIDTTCTFRNDGSAPVGAGEDTTDEMCFDFVYATPPPDARYCDEGDDDMPTDVRYLPGACLPESAPREAPLVRGSWVQAETPPVLAPAATIPEARWQLESVTFYVTSITTPIGVIDLERTYVLSRGQVVTHAGELAYDVTGDSVVTSEDGVRFGGPESSSFTASFPDASGTATTSCPGTGSLAYDLGVDGDVLTVGFESSDVPGATLWPRFTFRRVP